MSGYFALLCVMYFLVVLFRYWLKCLNLSYLKKNGSIIPPEFEGHIDQSLLNKTRDYVVEDTRLGVFISLFHTIYITVFFFCGLLNWYNSWIASLGLSFIPSGLVFFLLLACVETALTLPFDFYHTFKIERKYGFTTTTVRLWVTDQLKSLAVFTALTAAVMSAGLYLVQASPNWWWFWVWGFFFGFSMLMLYLFPYVIAPLFNKFIPIKDEKLREGIQHLMQKVGIRVKNIFTMDASRRTRHTNAYFTGIGRVKRIVLYDTLVEKMDVEEVLAVLAHEAGHWKKRHLLKYLIFSEVVALVVICVSFKTMGHDFLASLFSLQDNTFFAKVVILSFIGSIVSFPLTPLFHYFSRRHEKEADRFSYEITGSVQGMVRALIKLSKDNLSNLHPHPFYSAFYYSHPPALDRIRYLNKLEENKRDG